MHEGLDAGGGGSADDQAGVVLAVESLDDFGSVVSGRVGGLLAGEGDDAAGVVVAELRQVVVKAEEGGELEAGPLDPGVEAGGELNDLGDVGAADAGGGFEEVEAAVFVGADELGVGDAGSEVKSGEDLAVGRRGGRGRWGLRGRGCGWRRCRPRAWSAWGAGRRRRGGRRGHFPAR